jgi:hypothetical protein
LPATLRYLPANNRYPDAMIAAFGLATEVEPGVIKPPDVINGVHLTRLTRDGHKAPDPSTGKAKIMIGSCIGAPIVLAPPNDLLGLTISEGVEDALTLAQALGIGAWAAGSAGFMPGLALLVPSYIEQVTVYQDDDQAGRANATELARALEVRGFDVRIEQGVNR